MKLKFVQLSCDFKTEALGIGRRDPLLQWKLEAEANGDMQRAYRVCVASEAHLLDAADLWDSGRVECADNRAVYAGKPLASNQKAYWRVSVWDGEDEISASEIAYWRQGVHAQDWQGEWIGYDEGREAYDPSVPYYCADDFELGENHPFLPKPALLRREFAAEGEIVAATLYVSALGLTQMYLNGEKAFEDHLVPGLCDYNKRAYYFAYDVSALLRPGENAVSAVLADGWYAGYIGLNPRQWWGAKPRLNAELHIEYADGRVQIEKTDASWRAMTGPWLYADIMHGTGYDATLEPVGWKQAGYDASAWHCVETGAEYDHIPGAHPGVPMVEHERYPAAKIRRIGEDEAIVDFGRCFSGVVCARLRGPRGAKVDFRHAEELTRDGSDLFYFGNRSAELHDQYVLAGEGIETFQPEFTYRGFRYVHIWGLKQVELVSIEGVAISSALPEKTGIETGNDVLNNVIWMIRNTQQSNMHDMPTDVCTRDERLGWGAEGNFFMHTAAALNNNALFLRKWMRDHLDSQQENGALWATAPAVLMKDIVPFMGDLQSDIAMHCAWMLVKRYNDLQPVAESYEQLEKYMAHSLRNSDRLLRYATARDWLDLGHEGRSDFDHGYGKCDPTLVGTAWFARCAQMMAEVSEALGKAERAAYYADLASQIKTAFRTFFLGRNKQLRGSTQGGYLLAAAFGLIEGEELKVAREWLLADMEKRGGISWGTASTPIALQGMCKLGMEKEAAAFVRRSAFPSIGYMATQGATAVWERWDGIYEGQFHPHQMNAFDHIGLATVGQWIVTGLAGIDADANGYSAVKLEPVFDREIGYVKAKYESVHGTVESSWRFMEDGIHYEVALPVGAEGRVILPYEQDVIRILQGEGSAKFGRSESGKTEMLLTSGRYEFIIRPN